MKTKNDTARHETQIRNHTFLYIARFLQYTINMIAAFSSAICLLSVFSFFDGFLQDDFLRSTRGASNGANIISIQCEIRFVGKRIEIGSRTVEGKATGKNEWLISQRRIEFGEYATRDNGSIFYQEEHCPTTTKLGFGSCMWESTDDSSNLRLKVWSIPTLLVIVVSAVLPILWGIYCFLLKRTTAITSRVGACARYFHVKRAATQASKAGLAIAATAIVIFYVVSYRKDIFCRFTLLPKNENRTRRRYEGRVVSGSLELATHIEQWQSPLTEAFAGTRSCTLGMDAQHDSDSMFYRLRAKKVRTTCGFGFLKLRSSGASNFYPNGWVRHIDEDQRAKIPFELIVLAILLIPTIRLALKYRQYFRVTHGFCVHCGYDLRASSDRCPECGAEFGEYKIVKPRNK